MTRCTLITRQTDGDVTVRTISHDVARGDHEIHREREMGRAERLHRFAASFFVALYNPSWLGDEPERVQHPVAA